MVITSLLKVLAEIRGGSSVAAVKFPPVVIVLTKTVPRSAVSVCAVSS